MREREGERDRREVGREREKKRGREREAGKGREKEREKRTKRERELMNQILLQTYQPSTQDTNKIKVVLEHTESPAPTSLLHREEAIPTTTSWFHYEINST